MRGTVISKGKELFQTYKMLIGFLCVGSSGLAMLSNVTGSVTSTDFAMFIVSAFLGFIVAQKQIKSRNQKTV